MQFSGNICCGLVLWFTFLFFLFSCEDEPFMSKMRQPSQTFRNDLQEFKRNIYFKFYDKDANVKYISTSDQNDDLTRANCDIKTEKLALIAHGWRQDCNEDWVKQLVRNLIEFRGGCIICMDYSYFSRESYYRLFRQFENITSIMAFKLISFQKQGFQPDRGYMFGFSFGGQMVVHAAKHIIGPIKFKEIDACDMAGPGFDRRVEVVDYRNAAENVQCIHTSRSYGTHYSNGCHQDWKMGNCGITQDAGEDNAMPFGSHGLCPIFYNIAFRRNFLAVQKPAACYRKSDSAYNVQYPKSFKMGYNETRKRTVFGVLYAYTTEEYPYVAAPNEIIRVKPKRVNAIELHLHRSQLEFKNDSIIL